MSGEQIAQVDLTKTQYSSGQKKYKSKVDINVLLSKVRSEEKKERYESIIFISLLSSAILVTGIIVSF